MYYHVNHMDEHMWGKVPTPNPHLIRTSAYLVYISSARNNVMDIIKGESCRKA